MTEEFCGSGGKYECSPQLVFRNKYWSYIPQLIEKKYFSSLFPQLEKVCKSYNITMYGKSFPSRRISVLYTEDLKDVSRRVNSKSDAFDYKDTPSYEWKDSPLEILEIRKIVEDFTGVKYDYVLCHIYRGLGLDGKPGSDYIGYHVDKEAFNSEIVSVSLGATRKFQFRKIGEKEVSDEILLKSGDVVHMFGPRKNQPGCQRKYEHQVPPMNISELCDHIEKYNIPLPKGRKTYVILKEIIEENNIIPDRINLTFRQFE